MNTPPHDHDRPADERTRVQLASGPDNLEPKIPSESPMVAASRPRPRRFRLSRLVLKELRETLRDRRTIITLLLMPLLVYPALSLVFKSFLLSNALPLTGGEPIRLRLVYAGAEGEKEEDVKRAWAQVAQFMTAIEQREQLLEKRSSSLPEYEADNGASGTDSAGSSAPSGTGASGTAAPQLPAQPTNSFAAYLDHQWRFAPYDPEVDLESIVDAGQVDAALVFSTQDKQPGQLGKIEIIRSGTGVSAAAATYLNEKLEKLNRVELEQRRLLTLSETALSFAESKLSPADLGELSRRLRRVELPEDQGVELSERLVGGTGSFPLASMVPLILVLMTITGAVYPAIDLTAGERERGTLETLMAAPIPRFSILFAKFLAVLTVAMLTAILNISGMFATVWAFQLDKQFGGGMFGFDVMIQMLLLLVLFAAFFSSILLVVTSFAKSFKEAQVYLIPVILLSLGPCLMALAPGMSLAGPYAVCPMINILLLSRDVIEGNVEMIPAAVAIGSTIIYSLCAIGLAARFFGSDAILYADSGSLMESVQRPKRSSLVTPFAAAMGCLVLLFPLNFASGGFLARLPSESSGDIQYRFLLMAVFLFLWFMALPTLVARHQKTSLSSGFGLTRPKVNFLIAGVLLGVSLWPIVMSLTDGWQAVYGWIAGPEAMNAWKEKLLQATGPFSQMIREIRPEIVAICFSLVPAVCEEWFFRGMLLRTLVKETSPAKAILLSAALFGAFHMISSSVIFIDRLLPTALVGLVLGYLAYKSNSIWPGCILHAIHNAFIIFLAYYQETLVQQSWFPADESIPMTWTLSGLAVAAVGLGLIALTTRTPLEFELADH